MLLLMLNADAADDDDNDACSYISESYIHQSIPLSLGRLLFKSTSHLIEYDLVDI